MKGLRVFLAAAFTTIFTYTLIVSKSHGMNLFPIFFNDLSAMNWSGQFNLDFTISLSLTGLWVAWRNKFSALGIGLGLFTLIGGMLFITAYLFALSFKCQNSVKTLIIGDN